MIRHEIRCRAQVYTHTHTHTHTDIYRTRTDERGWARARKSALVLRGSYSSSRNARRGLCACAACALQRALTHSPSPARPPTHPPTPRAHARVAARRASVRVCVRVSRRCVRGQGRACGPAATLSLHGPPANLSRHLRSPPYALYLPPLCSRSRNCSLSFSLSLSLFLPLPFAFLYSERHAASDGRETRSVSIDRSRVFGLLSR